MDVILGTELIYGGSFASWEKLAWTLQQLAGGGCTLRVRNAAALCGRAGRREQQPAAWQPEPCPAVEGVRPRAGPDTLIVLAESVRVDLEGRQGAAGYDEWFSLLEAAGFGWQEVPPEQLDGSLVPSPTKLWVMHRRAAAG